jgi:hypothetical protein
MNHPLHISKEDREALIRVMAEMLMQRINFDPAELIVIPTATVAQWTGLSPKSVQRRFPMTIISTQKQGVLLSTFQEFLKKNTRPPSA